LARAIHGLRLSRVEPSSGTKPQSERQAKATTGLIELSLLLEAARPRRTGATIRTRGHEARECEAAARASLGPDAVGDTRVHAPNKNDKND
jgi:hypothetical protein